MHSINWLFFDKVIFINLKSRKDRRVRIMRQLKLLGVPKDKIVHFEAIYHAKGHIGCTLSHIAVLEMAQENCWERVLILEDDFSFVEEKENYKNINRYLQALSAVNWNVAFLAANYCRVTPLTSVDYIVRVDVAWCACAYITNINYYAKLIHNYRTGLLSLLQGGDKEKYALDVNWHSCMQQDLWLGIFPNSGYQVPDKSDIEGRNVDYRYLFNKPLHVITPLPKFIPSISGPIKVDFYFQWPAGWTNFESVIHSMFSNTAFDCQVVVVPYLNWKATDINGNIQRTLLKEKGIDYVAFEDYSLEARQPDVVFLQNPYDEARPEEFRSHTLHNRGVKIAYIPYALDTGIGEESMVYQYDLLCQNLATWIFARSQRHKDEFAVQCSAGNNHVHVTGHPKFDYYESRFPLCHTKNRIKTFLWTPHFILPGNVKMYSTFNFYIEALLKLLMRDDINLIIRPHPLFLQWINEADRTSIDNYKKLIDISSKRDNVSWDFSPDYKESFSKSHALIADAGSFLLEYLPSKKPILYLTHKQCHGLNRTAEFIYDTYDVAWNNEDIYRFVDNVINDIDLMKSKREKALREELLIENKTAGEKISEIILNSLRP